MSKLTTHPMTRLRARCGGRPDPPPSEGDIQRETEIQRWATVINAGIGLTVEGLISIGQALLDAKAALPHGEWERMFWGHPKPVSKPILFSVRTAQRYMRVATLRSKTTDLSRLPPTLTVLDALARLPNGILECALMVITPDITLDAVKERFGPYKTRAEKMYAVGSRRARRLKLVPGEYTVDCFVEMSEAIAEDISIYRPPTPGDRVRLRQAAQDIIDALDRVDALERVSPVEPVGGAVEPVATSRN